MAIGTTAALLGSAAIGAGGSLIAGNQQRQAAKGARNAQERALMLAEEQYRDPSAVIRDVYGDLYSPETQDVILGAERRLMQPYQQLQFERMGMITPELLRQQRGFQEAELGAVGELAGMAREAGEDPRLAQVADLSVQEAERLTQEAQEGISPLEIIKAERRAAQQGISRGRELDASQAARFALERRETEEDVQARRAELARAARGTAGQVSQAARIDPFTAILGRTPSAYSTAAQLSLGQLGGQATSPSMALALGQSEDYRKAQAELAKGGVESAYRTARGDITAGMIGGVASSLGSAIGGLGGSPSGVQSPVSQTPMTTGFGTVLGAPSGGFQTPGVQLGQGILGNYGGVRL